MVTQKNINKINGLACSTGGQLNPPTHTPIRGGGSWGVVSHGSSGFLLGGVYEFI